MYGLKNGVNSADLNAMVSAKTIYMTTSNNDSLIVVHFFRPLTHNIYLFILNLNSATKCAICYQYYL